MSTPQEIAPQAAAPRNVSRRRLWFGMLGSPLAWMAQYALVYPIAARACEGRPQLGMLNIQGAQTLIVAITVVLAAVALWAGYLAWGTWRTARKSEANALDADANNRAAFMGMGGVLLSAVFFVGILWNVLTPITLNACSQVA